MISLLTLGCKGFGDFSDILTLIMIWMSFIMQIIVLVYGVIVFFKMKWIRFWSAGFIAFLATMLLALLRRIEGYNVMLFISDKANGDFSDLFLMEAFWMVLMSFGWLFFIWEKKLFINKYLE